MSSVCLVSLSAEVDRHPLHAGVAPDLDPAGGDVEDLARAPVLVVGQVDLGAGQRVELEGPGVEGLALEVGGHEVLADPALGQLAHHREGVRVLGRARLVDQPDHLDRLLDLHVLGDVHEHAAGPEGRGGRGELALVVGQPLREVLLDQVRVLLDRLLEGHHQDALVGHVRVHDAGAALHDQAGVLLVAEVLAHDLGQLGRAARSAGLELVQGQLADGGGPEARAPPGGQRLALEDLEGGLAPVLHELSRHPRPPPRARTRSPSPRARRPARPRPRGRSGRRS